MINEYKQVLNRRYVLIFLLYFSFFFANGPMVQLISALIDSLGYTAVDYSLILSATKGLSIIVPGVVGIYSQRNKSYNLGIFGLFLSFVSIVLFHLIDVKLLIMLTLIIFMQGRNIFNFSIGNQINAEVPNDNRGKYFAIRDLFLFCAISVGTWVIGMLSKIYSLKDIYYIFAPMYLVSILIVAILKKQKFNISEEKRKASSKIHFLSEIKKGLANKKFRAFVFVDFFLDFSGAAQSYLVLLGLSLDITFDGMTKILSIVNMTNCIMGLALGVFADKILSKKKFFVFDIAFDILPYLLFALSENYIIFIAAYFLTAIKDILSPVSFAYRYECFEKDSSTYLGLLSSISNMVSIIIPLIMGILWTLVGAKIFYLAVIGNIAASLITVIFLPGKKVDKVLN